jgi:predicted nucleotidyltransferase
MCPVSDESPKDVLAEVIRRIVEVAHPEKIILFGSAARGEMGLANDLDLLVVKSGVHRRRLAQMIYRNLVGVDNSRHFYYHPFQS